MKRQIFTFKRTNNTSF